MSRYIDAEKIKYTEYINGDVTVSKDLVEKIPTADVQEVRHGKWIYRGHHEIYGHAFECSICERYLFANSKEHVYEEYPYCHCGAKMDEEEQQ